MEADVWPEDAGAVQNRTAAVVAAAAVAAAAAATVIWTKSHAYATQSHPSFDGPLLCKRRGAYFPHTDAHNPPLARTSAHLEQSVQGKKLGRGVRARCLRSGEPDGSSR